MTFRYGPKLAAAVPVIGDWNGDGTDTVGIFRSDVGVFYLRHTNTAGFADSTIKVFHLAGMPVVAGDWDGDGNESVGNFDVATSRFFLRNGYVDALADYVFMFRPPNTDDQPVAGNWDTP